jgi:hypothetical protein
MKNHLNISFPLRINRQTQSLEFLTKTNKNKEHRNQRVGIEKRIPFAFILKEPGISFHCITIYGYNGNLISITIIN